MAAKNWELIGQNAHFSTNKMSLKYKLEVQKYKKNNQSSLDVQEITANIALTRSRFNQLMAMNFVLRALNMSCCCHSHCVYIYRWVHDESLTFLVCTK